MALKDYNSIAFKNTAIDRMSGSFGKGPGDGVKKSASTTNTSATLANPWARPPLQAVTAPKVTMPKSNVNLSSSSTPSATSSTTASNYSMPVAKTLKDVKAENRMKKAQAKGEAAVQRINQRASMTTEQKEQQKQNLGKRIRNIGAGIGSGILGGIEILNKVEDLKAKKASNKPG